MDSYPVIKYVSSGISMFISQAVKETDEPVEFIDPICTMMKICIMSYKPIGTKFSIKNNRIHIDSPWVLQGAQRWMNSDKRNQLHQLRYPIFYFMGIYFGYIIFQHLAIDSSILNDLNNLAIKGLKKIKTTYNNEKNIGSMVKNCIDDYIRILSTKYTINEYMEEMCSMNKPTLIAIYNEYTKKWSTDDLPLFNSLFQLANSKENPLIQNTIIDAIDNLINAKDLEIDAIRPD